MTLWARVLNFTLLSTKKQNPLMRLTSAVSLGSIDSRESSTDLQEARIRRYSALWVRC